MILRVLHKSMLAHPHYGFHVIISLFLLPISSFLYFQCTLFAFAICDFTVQSLSRFSCGLSFQSVSLLLQSLNYRRTLSDNFNTKRTC